MKLQFITAIPLNVTRGSGCFVGIQTLARGIQALGGDVELITPKVHFPVFTAERILFNERLRFTQFSADVTVGFDLDGYRVARRRGIPHIAAIKGVLGDAVRFERGFTRASLALQAHLEKLHAQRAERVITISRSCSQRLEELYSVRNAIVVPELIDLDAWRSLFAANPAPPRKREFTVLCVCRFYPRKRVDVLIRAAQILREKIRGLEIRIVGGGPESRRLRQLSAGLRLENVVNWRGDTTAQELAREYNRADIFCLPSVQEGFGIVFLEAMAAGKPIVAARAAAVPEVVQHGLLVEPDNSEALAEAIYHLYLDSDLRTRLATSGKQHVENYEMKRVAAQFLAALA
ncbi:MAG: glycosyltransferase family 4 protein [Acidobacteriaceae bacterium]|nr:glycosyltransferase family 4 protein [Acidobacteriaceae bacterium]MBV9296710.1 glycosyltransferase family 4 protein [Acidobacteriaceae bacterium]MBV9767439.1 glycosyltransferase family 4 protein [Acidobacteriaceae bacterium]